MAINPTQLAALTQQEFAPARRQLETGLQIGLSEFDENPALRAFRRRQEFEGFGAGFGRARGSARGSALQQLMAEEGLKQSKRQGGSLPPGQLNRLRGGGRARGATQIFAPQPEQAPVARSRSVGRRTTTAPQAPSPTRSRIPVSPVEASRTGRGTVATTQPRQVFGFGEAGRRASASTLSRPRMFDQPFAGLEKTGPAPTVTGRPNIQEFISQYFT